MSDKQQPTQPPPQVLYPPADPHAQPVHAPAPEPDDEAKKFIAQAEKIADNVVKKMYGRESSH